MVVDIPNRKFCKRLSHVLLEFGNTGLVVGDPKLNRCYRYTQIEDIISYLQETQKSTDNIDLSANAKC